MLRLFEFCKTASSRLQSRASRHTDSEQNLLFPDLDFAPYSASSDENHKRSFLVPHIVPIGAPWQKIQLTTQKQKKIYVELFDMGTIKLTLRLLAR